MPQDESTQDIQSILLATFLIRGVRCAIDAASIQEVIRPGAITAVRRAPKDVAGIINLRGRIVTVLDLGLRLGFDSMVVGPHSRIFIVEDGNEFIGLLVDRVEEVVEVDREDWQAAPANVPAGQARFFSRVCRSRDRVLTILNTAAVLAADGVAA
jgi:purine-binding chemotaxis protein CheW